MKEIMIGVLALQGDFAKHQEILKSIGVDSIQIRKPEQLKSCSAMIIPGGESTTLVKLIDKYGLREAIRSFAESNPVMGTCAGAILLSRDADDERVKTLNLIDIEIQRNAYGRQVDSFIEHVRIECLRENEKPFEAVFIRAPKIKKAGREVQILAGFQGRPIMARDKNILILTFHPELTNDPRVHEYFLKQITRK